MTRRDPYAGQDLLADVFEGTEQAPDPEPLAYAGGRLVGFAPSPDDPRWKPLRAPVPSEGCPRTDPPGFVGPRPNQDASNGNGGSR